MVLRFGLTFVYISFTKIIVLRYFFDQEYGNHVWKTKDDFYAFAFNAENTSLKEMIETIIQILPEISKGQWV
jgi:hypothetical protein